jgi:hypothetical protein
MGNLCSSVTLLRFKSALGADRKQKSPGRIAAPRLNSFRCEFGFLSSARQSLVCWWQAWVQITINRGDAVQEISKEKVPGSSPGDTSHRLLLVWILEPLYQAIEGRSRPAMALFGLRRSIRSARYKMRARSLGLASGTPHLWGAENLFFELGDLGIQVWKTAFGRMSVAICYDGWFPETYRLAGLAGCRHSLHSHQLGPDAGPSQQACWQWQIFSPWAALIATACMWPQRIAWALSAGSRFSAGA